MATPIFAAAACEKTHSAFTPPRNLWKAGLFLIVSLQLFSGFLQGQAQQEEMEDYFKKWLEEDVIYTITEEEKTVFQKLQTIEEKERFIEQFWSRRDPTPGTSYNEFKEEHYRRVQYANERFSSGIPGWKTDRGMTYIKYGEPDRIDAHPSGGHYQRPSWEGGGSTSTYPFEVWEYRYIEGVGQDVEIEFVDPTLTGEYRMTTNPWDKDALLLMPGGGMTDAEAMGLANRVDRVRPLTNPMPWTNPLLIGYGRAKDQPFEKLNTFTNLQRPPKIDFADFRRPEVLTNIRYELLPFDLGVNYFSVDENNYLVPITIAVSNKHLDYVAEGDQHQAIIDVYGQVSTISGKVLNTFEETISSQLDMREITEHAQRTSIYQKSMQLPPGRYKLDVILRDEHSEKVGSKSMGVILPNVSKEDLTVSSLVLADRVEMAEDNQVQASPYGPAKVFPNVSGTFGPEQTLLLFYQLSNFRIDPTSQSGFLTSTAGITRGTEQLAQEQLKIDNSNAEHRDRLHLVHRFDLSGMAPGQYELVLEIRDQISEQAVEKKVPFQIAAR